MTNAEKYLKDGVIYHNLSCEIALYISNSLKSGLVQNIDDFFKQQVKPTITDDERVILRNIPKEYQTIGRNSVGEISARNDNDWKYADVFNHLFQFIKNGEEYNIQELLGDEK